MDLTPSSLTKQRTGYTCRRPSSSCSWPEKEWYLVSYRVGVDIGGTFTDGVVIGEKGTIDIFKDLSTPEDPSVGVFNV
ncbi:MAG: hydantoinase/oxoprolinase N-terminal domain-containing protein, partial [Anaerolineae bacterium]